MWLTEKEVRHNTLEIDITGTILSHYEIILWEMIVLRNIPVPDSRHRCCELTCQQYLGHALIYIVVMLFIEFKLIHLFYTFCIVSRKKKLVQEQKKICPVHLKKSFRYEINIVPKLSIIV